MSKNVKLSAVEQLRNRMLQNTQFHQAAQAAVKVDVERRMVKIRVEDCVPSRYQHRRAFDEEAIQSLAQTIADNGGLIEPIVVRPVAHSKYEIVAGERRWRAHKILEWATIDAIVRDLDEAESNRVGAIENIQRKNLTDYETFLAIRDLEAQDYYKTRANLAKHLNYARQDIYRFFAFQVLPEFIIEDLEKQPHLMSRRTADEIRRYLTNEELYPSEVVHSELRGLWEDVKSERLDRFQLATALSERLDGAAARKKPAQPAPEKPKKTEIIRSGKVIGKFERKGKFLHMRVSSDDVTDEMQMKLEDFLSELLNG